MLPDAFERRLSQAWANMIWRDLMPGSSSAGFSGADPITLLAHNLDFWVPPATQVVQDILNTLPVVDDSVIEEQARLTDGSVFDGAVIGSPRVGTDVWTGQHDAAEVTQLIVQEVDQSQKSRGILEAVRSNRVEEDFSRRWSYQREDFERKLNRKRSKIESSSLSLMTRRRYMAQ